MTKSNTGRFFEDYALGMVIDHAVPRTIGSGERALHHALYPARRALCSSDDFARRCGLPQSPIDDLIVFHVIFGKTVPDISLNAVANLGYAEGRWLKSVYPGDTLRSRSEVIGLKENSNGKSGNVYVRTTGFNQHSQPVMEYVRWVMLKKRDAAAPPPETVLPALNAFVRAEDLILPEGLNFENYDFSQAGERHVWADYSVGEKIDHIDGVTIEEAEHMLATRLWQNTSKVHFDSTIRPDGKRLIYGGHVISLAHALSFNGLANAQCIAALNSGIHANPCFSGMTVCAWSEVIDKAETQDPNIGALRLRLVAQAGLKSFDIKAGDGKYLPEILLDLDYWTFIPR